MRGAGWEFLSILGPGMEPWTLTWGKGVADNCKDFAHGAGTERMDTATVCAERDIEGRALFQDIECGAIALQLALTGADRPEPTAILVVDVIPVFGSFDEADGRAVVRLRAQASNGQKQDDGNDDSVHDVVIYAAKIRIFSWIPNNWGKKVELRPVPHNYYSSIIYDYCSMIIIL